MRSPLLRLALAASWSGRGVERRRAAMVASAAAVVTVMACGCASAWFMSARIDDRATGRAFSAAAPGAPVTFERSALFDETIDDRQIYVYWWRIVDPSARVPGVRGVPPVGSWFVSPALAERMAGEPALAVRYPDAGVIGHEGVAHRGELLAYRFVGPEVALSEQLSDQPGTDWIGDGAEAVDLYPIAVAALALIGVPGLGLLVAAMAPFAAQLERRLAVLDALGAPARAQRTVVLAHAGVCAGPGALLGAAGWFVVSPRLTAVPLVGRRVFASDLGAPLAAVAAVGAAVTVLAMIVAAVRPRRLAGNRPVARTPPRPTLARALPLVAGLVVMLAGVLVPDRNGAKVFLVGVVASAVGAVIALPYVLDRAGTALAQQPATMWLLVGRRLRWNAVASTRSLLAVGALAALVPLVAAWVAVARDVDRPPHTDRYVVELRGDLSEADRAQLLRRTGAAPLDVVATTEADGRQTLGLVGDCTALAAYLRFAPCGPTEFSLAPDPGMDLGGYTGLGGTAARPPGAQHVSTLFVSDDGAAVDQALRHFVVNASATGMQVTTPGRAVFHESPLVQWILGAARLAGVVGGLALVLHLVGQAARLAPSRARLLALGADIAVVRRLAGAEAAFAVALVGGGCTAVGAIASWLFVQIDGSAAVPYGAIALVIAATLTAAALAGAAAGAAVPDHPHPAGEPT